MQTNLTTPSKKVHSFTNQITVRNGKDKDVAANLAVWHITVPAGGDVVVTYSATVRFR